MALIDFIGNAVAINSETLDGLPEYADSLVVPSQLAHDIRMKYPRGEMVLSIRFHNHEILF